MQSCITLMRVRVRLFTLLRIRNRLFTLMRIRTATDISLTLIRIRIRILLLIKWCEFATNCLQTTHLFWASKLPLWGPTALHGFIFFEFPQLLSFNFAAYPDPAFYFDANPALHSDADPDPHNCCLQYCILTSGANSIDSGKNVVFCQYFCSIDVTAIVILYGEEIWDLIRPVVSALRIGNGSVQ